VYVLGGKFAQRDNLSKHEYVTDVKRYLKLMTSEALRVQDLKMVNASSPMVMLQYVAAENHVEGSANTNVVLAAFVTAQARLKLYSYLDQLGDRALYADTDSCLYSHTPGQSKLPLGDWLGCLTDEVPGDTIVEGVFSGAKNYGLNMASGASTCKIRGFTLNFRTARKVNFDSMRDTMLSEERFERRVHTVEPNALVKRGTGSKIYTKEKPKCYRFVFDKRRIINQFDTLPFGYKD